ncbi:AAA family ATPase [candidate division KSB1 bacterium]|nr:AAA family ATPase [candidate division KSB1 bacterium]
MSQMIAITGKGGVGKTTIAGLIIQRLIARGCRPVLAIDADPNSCLDRMLGIRAAKTVGRVREETREASVKGNLTGTSKQEFIEMKIAESLVEAEDFDFIAMGRPEGPGCYCYANNVLKAVIQQIATHYPYIVLDNEAGLENLSRRIVQQVDLMIMVSDSSHWGLETIGRLYDLAQEMEIQYHRLAIMINKIRNDQSPPEIAALQTRMQANFWVNLPLDPEIAAFAEAGLSLQQLPATNITSQRLDAFLDQL